MYDIINYLEWIDGDKFEDIADLHFSTLFQNEFQFNFKLNEEIENFEGIPTVYCDTDKIREFFNYLDINKEINLISHNGDSQIRDDEIKKPDFIKKWYANNYIGTNTDIISIPTGLERIRWFPTKIDIMKNIYQKERKIKNIAYNCHNILTNSDRSKIYAIVRDKSYITSEEGSNGRNFQRYFENLHSHVYTICPVGNSTGHNDGDCAVGSHRFWEALYMGSIPIVLDRLGNRKFEDLPALYINNWEDINENLLISSLDELNKKWKNIDILKFSYWKNKIKKNE